jgi:hypothetical protein
MRFLASVERADRRHSAHLAWLLALKLRNNVHDEEHLGMYPRKGGD